MSVHGCVRVGLTRTLPKAPMATSGGSSMGRAYVPPTYTNSGGISGHLRSTHIAKDSLAYPSNSWAIATATSFCILSSLCAYHTRVWDHCVHICDPQPKREVASIITDSSLLLQYIPHTTQATSQVPPGVACYRRLYRFLGMMSPQALCAACSHSLLRCWRGRRCLR